MRRARRNCRARARVALLHAVLLLSSAAPVLPTTAPPQV
eukprot:gene14750-64254_t